MRDMNMLLMGGLVGRHVRFFVLDDGKKLLTFDLANHHPGPKGRKTLWLHVAVFGEPAEPLANRLKPGTPLVLSGTLEATPKSLVEEGRPAVQVKADRVLVLGAPCERCATRAEKSGEIPWYGPDADDSPPMAEMTDEEMREAEALATADRKADEEALAAEEEAWPGRRAKLEA